MKSQTIRPVKYIPSALTSSLFSAAACGQKLSQGVLAGAALIIASLGFHAHAGGGTVTFGNHGSSLVINGLTGNPVTVDQGIRAALYWAPLGSSTFVQIGAAVTNVGFPLPGLLAGGTRTTGPATPGGSSAQFQVRAWGGGYATYEDALWYGWVPVGHSPIVQAPTGNPDAAPPTPPGSLLAGGLQSFTLTLGTYSPLVLMCASNKTVASGSAWTFDPPAPIGGCSGTNVTVSVVGTVTNGVSPMSVTRTWLVADLCGNSRTCSQAVTLVDTTPPVLTGFILSDGTFQLQMADPAQAPTLVIEASTNLVGWVPIFTNSTPTNLLFYADPDASNYLWRFYRAIDQW